MQVTKELLQQRPLSFSSLKEFIRSPRHYVNYLTRERKQTEAMLFGAICHKLILEPQDFEKEYIIEPEFNKRTNQGKDDYAAFIAKITEQNLTAIPASTYAKAMELLGSLAYSTVVLASLFGVLLWQEMLPLDSWLAVALIIGSGIMSVIANAQSQTRN